MANIKINGKEYTVEGRKTIYESLVENGYDIPVFCQDELLKSFGSCRLCMVEVKNKGKVPSCSVEVSDGMSIITINEEIKNLRKMDLELLLSDHYADCIAPCQLACPAQIDVQGYIALINNKRYKEAVKLIKEKVPFPATLGRVCPHPCEKECRRALVDEAISICKLKRLAADVDFEPYIPQKEKDREIKVAVVGGGPAGLSSAYYLALKGYDITVFEAMPKLGGMLRYGIPEYRLPRNILDKEIKSILDLGVKVKTNVRLGKDFTLDSLNKEGFKAVFLAVGAHQSRNMGCDGEKEDFVMQGIDFTRAVGLGKVVKVGNTVAVIGGGNTAIDCARISLRLGAKKVIIVYRRSRNEMPASCEEVEATEHEGVKFLFLANPVAILEQNGRKILRCIKMELGEPDESGRRKPVPVCGSEFDLEVDNVFLALGQLPELSGIEGELEIARGNLIKVDEEYKTSKAGIFAGGDAVIGAATVVEACAAGRKASESIAVFLKEKEPLKIERFLSKKKEIIEKELGDLKEQPKKPREKQSELEVKERINNFREVELGLTELQGEKESARCLECGCNGFFKCLLRKYSTEYNANQDGFSGLFSYHKKDSTHYFIEKDFNKCILCARCVRVCDEVWGLGIWGFVNRGFPVQIQPPFGKSLLDTDCESCGYCVDLCPTGALTEKNANEKIAPYDCLDKPSICSYCGAGCTFYFSLYGDKIIKVKRKEADKENKISLCYKGKFSYEYIEAGDRNRSVRIKEKGSLKEVDVKKGINFASEKLLEIKEKCGSESLAIMASKKLTNEELYLLGRLKDALGIKYFNSFTEFNEEEKIAHIYSLWDKLADFGQLQESDLAISLDKEALKLSPVVKAALRQKAKRGERVYILGKYDAELKIKMPEVFLEKKSEDFLREFNFAEHENPVLVFDYSTIRESVLKQLAEISSKHPHIRFLPVFSKCNALGFYYFTENSRHTSELLEKLEGGRIKGMLIFGEDPLGCAKNYKKVKELFEKIDFVLTGDMFSTESLKSSHVSFPLTSIAESGGSFINMEGYLQFVTPALKSALPSWKILSDLLKVLGTSANYRDIEELLGEMVDKNSEFSKIKKELIEKKSAKIDLKDKESHKAMAPSEFEMEFNSYCSSLEARFEEKNKKLKSFWEGGLRRKSLFSKRFSSLAAKLF